jgi:hypothetical protein
MNNGKEQKPKKEKTQPEIKEQEKDWQFNVMMDK